MHHASTHKKKLHSSRNNYHACKDNKGRNKTDLSLTLVNSSSKLVPNIFGASPAPPGPGPWGVGGVSGVWRLLGYKVGGVGGVENCDFEEEDPGVKVEGGEGRSSFSDDNRLFIRCGGSGGSRRGSLGGGYVLWSLHTAAAALIARLLLSIRCCGSTVP